MKQNSVIGLIAIAILLILGTWYFTSRNVTNTTGDQMATSSVATTTASSDTATKPTTSGGSVSFHSIFTQTGNTQCDYNQTDSDVQGTSVIYISGGKMHAEFRTTTNGVKVASKMIYNGGYLYSWKEGATVGTKASIKSLNELPTVIPADLTSAAILGTSADNVGWNCHPWVTDQSMFAIPSYVTFSK